MKLRVNPCPRSEESSDKSVHQVPTETPLPQSSAGIREQAIEDDPRKQLELSVPQYNPGEWKYEFKMSTLTTTIVDLLYAEAEKMGNIRNFRMYIGPGSDGSSAHKVSIDLKFNPWDTAITFRPEWRSMSKPVFTQYDPFEPWYTCQSTVRLCVKRFYPRPMRCVIVVHPYPFEPEDPVLMKQHAFPVARKKKMRRRFTFLSRHAQRQARDAEQETKERNIRQHSIHHRDAPDHMEFTD